MPFSALGLAEPLVRALAAKGYNEPTPIQRDSIPTLLEGRDLLGIAQTGTGKTAAFVLPSIQQLVAANKRVLPTHCRMLVLAPTRELASQIADNARGYAQFSKLSVATVFGGTSINKNRTDVARGVDILVATPGRLIDVVEQGYLNLSMIEILVLDEADQMLDLGFIHALKKIVRMLPRKRQTLFFSATMPPSIRQLADQFLTDPATVSVVPQSTTAERVDQSVIFCNQQEKQALLTILLKDMPIDRALVFTRTKHGADRVVKLLAGNGVAASAIHGNKSQPQRERALALFKSGEVPILVATDIAARGIDVSGVSHVFNFELPNVPEQYVHRIGRTARAGASGEAIAFCAEDERPYLKDIEKLTRQKVPVAALPEDFLRRAEAIKAERVKAIGADPAPREDRPRGARPPARPKATHQPRATGGTPQARGQNARGGQNGGGGSSQPGESRYANASRRRRGGRGRGAGGGGGAARPTA
ncbi:DEAD/DEAH box helicase [Sphingomonas ginsenosidimutans]|jgi:ATP-dependent RNA helicase RhlE|uniref:DEAD/DEAH box helicase n=1 Tax=Sphingomonas ginsenosidimutans TaxID=862134 RepID=A0A2A4I3L7_9SPHN|nr:DEAD/DEAH box helicase [Sphingomonas ginsenosidimutans]MEE2916357.1 DEAD/DEAH box helicase [Pseudomonadota bacterium]PCG10881.1 DEAD/DEAH box helicase [Sphingomonas ginsenosidimutans]